MYIQNIPSRLKAGYGGKSFKYEITESVTLTGETLKPAPVLAPMPPANAALNNAAPGLTHTKRSSSAVYAALLPKIKEGLPMDQQIQFNDFQYFISV